MSDRVVPAADVVSLGQFRSEGTRALCKTSAIEDNAATKFRLAIRPLCRHDRSSENFMTISMAHIQPIVALIAGILILVMPRLLNFIVAIYLIFIGIIGLGIIK